MKDIQLPVFKNTNLKTDEDIKKEYVNLKKRLFELVDFISSYKEKEENLEKQLKSISSQFFLNEFEYELNKNAYLENLKQNLFNENKDYFYDLKSDANRLSKALTSDLHCVLAKDLFFDFYEKLVESNVDDFKKNGLSINFEKQIQDLVKNLFDLSYLPELIDKIEQEQSKNQINIQEKHDYWLKHLVLTSYITNNLWLEVILTFNPKTFAFYYSHHSDKVNNMLCDYANTEAEKFTLLFNYLYDNKKDLIQFFNTTDCLHFNYTTQIMMEKLILDNDFNLSNFLNIHPNYFEKMVEKLKRNQFDDKKEKIQIELDIVDFKQKIQFLLNMDLVKSGKIARDWSGVSLVEILENLIKDVDTTDDIENLGKITKIKNLLKLLLISYSDEYWDNNINNYFYSFFQVVSKLEKRIIFHSNLSNQEIEKKKQFFYQILNDFIQEAMEDDYYSNQLMNDMLQHKSSLGGLVFLQNSISMENKILFLKWFYESRKGFLYHFKNKDDFQKTIEKRIDFLKDLSKIKENNLFSSCENNLFDLDMLYIKNFFVILNEFKFMDLNFFDLNKALFEQCKLKALENKQYDVIEIIDIFNSIKQHIYQPNDYLEELKNLLIDRAKQKCETYVKNISCFL